jgi:branched-chain amino acid transport system permease protein
MAIIGGPRLIWGPAFGAIVFFFAKDIAGDVTEHWQAIIGVILIVVILVLPAGLGGTLAGLWWRGRGYG